MRDYQLYVVAWEKVPPELRSSESRIENFLPYCQRVGKRSVDLNADPVHLLQQLKISKFPGQISIEEIADDEFCISFNKEPCLLLKRVDPSVN